MTREVVLILASVLSYYIMRELTGVRITEVLVDFIAWALSFLSKTSRQEYLKSKQEFSRMSNIQKHKSWRYRYYAFVNDLLICLNLKSIGITVEGISIVIGLCALALTFGASMVINNIVLFIITFAITYVGIFAFLYLISRIGYRERKKEILETLDILCSVMSDGIVLAVKSSMHLIPPSIKPYFSKFLINIENLNKSMEESVMILNDDLGELFDEFCETVIMFEHDRAPGMDSLFSFIIADNAKELLRDKKIERESNKVNKDFAATCILLVLTVLYTIASYDFVRGVYQSSLGQFLLIAYVLLGLVVFIFTQYLMAKPYRYKEK